jgi:hypothetical protein
MAKRSTNRPAGKEQEATDRADKDRWERAKNARKANAEKQKRYRKSMKAQGYRAKLIWEKPLEAGWVKAEAPVIRESSLDITANNPVIKEVLKALPGTFIFECKRQGMTEEVWEPVYRDFQTLLKPFGFEE